MTARTGTTTLGEALGIATDPETGERTLTLNTMQRATCACGNPPRLHTVRTSATLMVRVWVPREHACKAKGQK